MARNTVIDVRGCKMHVHRDGAGEPLLFLHGAQGLQDNDPSIAALAKHFDVIAPDHPGFGRSASADTVETVPELALFYLDVLDALGLQAVHVVGHCIGGWIALEMAVTSSHRFKSMVLLNSAGLRVKGVRRADMFVCSESDLLKLLFGDTGGPEWLSGWRATPELEDMYDRNRAAAAKYSWSPRLCNPKLDRWLHRISTPTRVIWGDEARVIPKEYAKALCELIPGASMTTLAGCGHLAHLQQPELFAEQVVQFVRRGAP